MQTQKIKVFIACPYSCGGQDLNVRRCMSYADKLIGLDFVPFISLLYHFQNIVFFRPEEVWKTQDIEWLLSCDALLRIPGPSKGADEEMAIAYNANIPVFSSIEDLEEWRDK